MFIYTRLDGVLLRLATRASLSKGLCLRHPASNETPRRASESSKALKDYIVLGLYLSSTCQNNCWTLHNSSQYWHTQNEVLRYTASSKTHLGSLHRTPWQSTLEANSKTFATRFVSRLSLRDTLAIGNSQNWHETKPKPYNTIRRRTCYLGVEERFEGSLVCAGIAKTCLHVSMCACHPCAGPC